MWQKYNARQPKFWNSRTRRDVGVRWQKAEEKGASKLVKVRQATPTDFDGDRRKGHAFFNTCCLYFAIVGDLFPNN